MRTLTTPATLLTGRANAEPVLLVTLTTTSGTVFKLSDYNRVIEGVEYQGLIQNPQDLTEALNDFDGGGSPATAQLVLFNGRPVGGKARFSDLIKTPRNQSGTYDFRNARVDIDRLEQGHGLVDAVRLQSFYLEAPNEIGDTLITLQMSDLSLKIEDALPITKVTKALFPKAPPDAIQQEIRRPFGTLKNVKAMPIKDGAAGALSAALSDTDTSIALVDGTEFSTTGTGLIESEFITWTGKSGLHTLTGVTRGTQSTTAVAHDSGLTVLEILSEYIFVVGEGTSHLPSTINLTPDGTFDTDLGSFTDISTGTGSATWVAGRVRLQAGTVAGTGAIKRNVSVTNGAVYSVIVEIDYQFGGQPHILVGSTDGASDLLDSGGVTDGTYTYDITATSSLLSLTVSAVAGGSTRTFVDNVQIRGQAAGALNLPIKSLTNIRVHDHPARTSPTVTVANTALVANRNFGTITFTPPDVKLFHTLPQGLQETFTPAALSVTGDGATNVQQTRVITPTVGSAEVSRKTRRTISWTVTTTTAFTDTNHWSAARYLTSAGAGSAVTFGGNSGVAGNTTGFTWSGSHTVEYDSDGTETIAFASLLGSAKIITFTFTEAWVTYPDTVAGSGSTSAVVIGEVVCDVEGISDDTNGTVTGTASLLLENPADILTVILQAMYGVIDTDFDATWDTTRSILTTAGYRWAGLLGFRQFSDLRRTFSEQARSRLVLTSGRVGLRFRGYRPAADVTFQYDPAGGRTGLAQAISVRLTSPTELILGLTVRYAFDDAKGSYQKSLTFGDPVAAAATPAMELAFVSDDTTARDIGAYWFYLKSRPRFAVDGTAWHNALALEQGDHIAIKGHPALVQHGDDALIFGLLRKADRGNDSIGQIALGGLEDTIEGDVGPEDTSMAWGSRGLLAKNNAATPNTKIDVTAAAVVLRNSSNAIVIRHNPGSLTVDLGAAGPVANGRDQAGAHTASSWVHVYWIWDATNGVLALTSSATAPPTGPTFPTNFTYWGYVGAFYFTAGSALIRTTIAGSWASRQNVEALAAAVTDNAEHSIDGTAIWPPNAMRIGGHWGAVLNSAGDSADLRPESGVDSGPHLETPGATTTGFGGGFRCNVTGQTLWYIQSANASRVWRLEIHEYCLPNGGEG